jgi:TfoX/Sxy family transcriptional regulator of competence genes
MEMHEIKEMFEAAVGAVVLKPFRAWSGHAFPVGVYVGEILIAAIFDDGICLYADHKFATLLESLSCDRWIDEDDIGNSIELPFWSSPYELFVDKQAAVKWIVMALEAANRNNFTGAPYG